MALTRTKNRVYIVTPQQRPSDFVRELVSEYLNVELRGTLDEKQASKYETKHCPICGFPLQFRYKRAYGLKLWICSNESEICDFITNDIRGGEMTILKCDKCHDGYLIVKPGKNEPFLGCTNYRRDGTGCDGFMTKAYYLKHIK